MNESIEQDRRSRARRLAGEALGRPICGHVFRVDAAHHAVCTLEPRHVPPCALPEHDAPTPLEAT